jgi:D-aminopeptidase
MTRPRLRQLGITIGSLPTGPFNAITDVPGILVGHTTLVYDQPRVARTGVTAIVPRQGKIWHEPAFAGFFSFNGTGEMTGMHWLEESGLLNYPILLTCTNQVGAVHEAVLAYGQHTGLTTFSSLPVVGETYDGWLNDMDAFHIKAEHVIHALESAAPGPVAEGNVGGGTGMICHDFKGGIGTASRLVSIQGAQYTLGVLVQANHGDRQFLRVDGVPVGREIGLDRIPSPWDTAPDASSILIVIATDAPLLPMQCKRLARRAALGMGRVGGLGHNFSGDLFLAFSTGNHLPGDQLETYALKMLPNSQMNDLFQAVVEAVEEAILNCLTAAETMLGFQDRKAYALPLDELLQVMAKYGRQA